MNQATPKTLTGAIENGLTEAFPRSTLTFTPLGTASSVIKNHVLDFLRQKFGAAYLEMDDANNKDEATAILKKLAVELGVDKRG